MNTRMLWIVSLASMGIAPCASAEITVSTSRAGFDAAAANVAVSNFENLPYRGSSCGGPRDQGTPIDNPLTTGDVVLTDLYCLQLGACGFPTCQDDPENPFGSGNIVAFLNPGGFVTPGVGQERSAVVLVLEGNGGNNRLHFTAEDYTGATVAASADAVPYGVAYLSLSSPDGIRRVTFLRNEYLNGGCEGCNGPVVISAVLTGDQSPKGVLQNLSEDVAAVIGAGSLSPAQGDALTSKLNAASASFDHGNNKAASNQVQAFANQVQAFMNSRKLDNATGQRLLDAAAQLVAMLGS